MRRAAVLAMALTACVPSSREEGPPPRPSSAVTTAPIQRGTIAPIGVMSVPRAVQSSTRLDDGSVLIAGGCSDAGCELGSDGGSTAEIFDPVTGTFRTVGALGGFRDDHGAALLPDGHVLLAGGWGEDGVMQSTELFDPAVDRFTPGPQMASARAGFTPVTLRDGRILLAGGFLDNDVTTAAAEIFEPDSGAIEPTQSMHLPRGAYAASVLPDGRVLVAGGLSHGDIVGSSEIYDPANGRFEPTGSMRTARYKAAAVTLHDGTVMVIGGAGDVEGTRVFATTEIYDPALGTFRTGPTMAWPRYKLGGSVVPLPDGSVFVAGGAPRAERFDPVTGRFTEIPGELGGDRLFLAAALAGRDHVLLTGGYDGAIVPTDQAWLYSVADRSG